MSFFAELKVAFRSLLRARGLTVTVIVTLALGIGANAAMFSVVRGVLLRPLVNRDEGRLIYIRQSAPGINVENMTFSVPELIDLRSRMKSVTAVGDFSVVSFTMVGLGEPRVVRSGVVGGSFFDVMGLRPIRGRLIDASDDGPNAAPVVVLTHRFWVNGLGSDPNVIGKQIRLTSGADRLATVIGILEPSVPYPTETEIIANVVSSPHHMAATMTTGRTHRMTELFARLAPNATLELARTELNTVESGLIKEFPEAYPTKNDFHLDAKLLRDQIVSRARTVLLVLLAASVLIFIIACSNVANLILARSVQRESELALRAALGATTLGLRRTLLAESLLLGGSGAALGVLIALWTVPVLGRYAARFSVRALELSVDPSLLWVGVGLAMVAAVLLAFVPRLPTADTAGGLGPSGGSIRITSGTGRRLRAFAVTQIGASFVLLAGASMLLTTLIALQTAPTPFDTTKVLAINVPVMRGGNRTPAETKAFYADVARMVSALPGVERASLGSFVPWRDGAMTGQFTVQGYKKADGEEDPRARVRFVSPGFFATLGMRIIAGRDFNDTDEGGDRVVIISQSIAQQMGLSIESIVDRSFIWTDQVMHQFMGEKGDPVRIVGVVADMDDENIVPQQAMTAYQPGSNGRLFVRTAAKDPYALVPAITRIIRQRAPDQPVERAATLEDVKADILTPDRLNTMVFGAFALVALTIAIVGVAGVLAFSVSTRTKEFGIRMAIGSEPGQLLGSVMREGAAIAGIGVVTGVISGIVLMRVAGALFGAVRTPSPLAVSGAATLLVVAALLASWMPAARASRVDIIQALRSE